ncbi:major facilitator superfamily domain-containing protein [Dactylonectria macrodidyma]|uniref:Major facilitator superfamily domain-containing protein n=1 Tax=Dactylonectria macrodidyma TaxID=307937 RepID=A0A9P9EPQ9_9HYPO|nr:major facilitator superfamily domain-containing protein [Dactylonectria macrodidyma]
MSEATAAPNSVDNASHPEEPGHQKPVGFKIVLITMSLMLAVLCVALDNTIIAVAIPDITVQFKVLNDVGWYASAYLLTTCALQLLFGKLYALFNVKLVFLTALFVFELGSLICGVAPNSTTLIVGRAIAGLGSAGIFTGSLVTIAHTVERERRPIFFGLLGGMYGIASVAGPLMGGAFTDHATWRWCFYINLPLGAVTAVVLFFLLKIPHQEKPQRDSLSRTLRRLDPIGTAIFVPSIICMLLALQWGGVKYPWSNARIIVLFVMFGVLLVGFIAVQIYMKDDATVPSRIASQRTVASAALFGFCIGGSFFIFTYYIPIWFQVIMGTSAIKSGINSLPMILANVVGIILAGALTTRTGHYAPFFIASSGIMAIGAGMLTLYEVETPQEKWAGFLFLYGFGVGLGFQQGGVAAQAVLPLADVSIGTAMVMFFQMLGGALFVSVAQNLFTNRLVSNLMELSIAGLEPEAVVNAGATAVRSMVDPEMLPQVLVAYNDALVKTFQLGLILSCLSVLGAIGVEWKSIKGKEMAPGGA